jgi:cell division protein ZapA (FtsZ GTPase activity inhibitor)
MSQKLPCNLLLGIQALALKVSPEEEYCVRSAASLVNELVRYYEKKTNSSDPNKVMALVALDLAMCGVKFENEINSLNSNVDKQNNDLLELVKSYNI